MCLWLLARPFLPEGLTITQNFLFGGGAGKPFASGTPHLAPGQLVWPEPLFDSLA